MPKSAHLTGQSFEWLRVVARAGSRGGKALWDCVCLCGRPVRVTTCDLRGGHTTSCGCRKIALNSVRGLRHGHARRGPGHSKTWVSWSAMWTRCTNKNVKSYSDYGARGITIDPRWEKFENFLQDMGERPDGYTLERRDNNGSYTASNCTWATRKEQARNTRLSRTVMFEGRKYGVAELSELAGISYRTAWYRLNNGWTVPQIISTRPYSGNRIGRKINK